MLIKITNTKKKKRINLNKKISFKDKTVKITDRDQELRRNWMLGVSYV